MSNINLKKLAEMLSMNISTVSRALSGHPDVRPETRKRVEDAAREFNYVPNLHARFFRKKKSSLVALILPEINMFFIPDMMKGLNQVLKENGYSLIVFQSDNNIDTEADLIKYCLSWVVDALIISVSEETKDLEHLNPLKESGIPVVLVDRVLYTGQYTTVSIDGEGATKEIVNLLLVNKKKKILGIFNKSNLEITKRRSQGFLRCMEENNISPNGYNIIFIENYMNLEEEIEKVIEGVDAIFAMSDYILFEVYSFLRKKDLYPEKISLVAISDGKLPEKLHPKVTYVQHSGFEVGATAAKRALEMISSPQSVENIKVPVTIQMRSSIF